MDYVILLPYAFGIFVNGLLCRSHRGEYIHVDNGNGCGAGYCNWIWRKQMTCCVAHRIAGWSIAPCAGLNPDEDFRFLRGPIPTALYQGYGFGSSNGTGFSSGQTSLHGQGYGDGSGYSSLGGAGFGHGRGGYGDGDGYSK